jgi:hypothetical protein
MLLWVGCIAGALDDSSYRSTLTAAGFRSIEIEPTRIYDINDARAFLSGQGIDVDTIAPRSKEVHERLRPGHEAGELLRAGMLRVTLSRRCASEAIGTALLLIAVVGSASWATASPVGTWRLRCSQTR